MLPKDSEITKARFDFYFIPQRLTNVAASITYHLPSRESVKAAFISLGSTFKHYTGSLKNRKVIPMEQISRQEKPTNKNYSLLKIVAAIGVVVYLVLRPGTIQPGALDIRKPEVYSPNHGFSNTMHHQRRLHQYANDSINLVGAEEKPFFARFFKVDYLGKAHANDLATIAAPNGQSSSPLPNGLQVVNQKMKRKATLDFLGKVTLVERLGNLIFAVSSIDTDNMLSILDASDPDFPPLLLKTLKLPAQLKSIKFDGDYAYGTLIDNAHSVININIAVPRNARIVGTFASTVTYNIYSDVGVVGENYLYLIGQPEPGTACATIEIINNTDRAHPVLHSTLPCPNIPGINPSEIAVSKMVVHGRYCYISLSVGKYTFPTQNYYAIWILDCLDPSTPIHVSIVKTIDAPQASNLYYNNLHFFKQGTRLYNNFLHNYGDYKFVAHDLTNQTNPRITTLYTFIPMLSLDIVDGVIYNIADPSMSTGYLGIYNFEDFLNATIISSTSITGATSLAVIGENCYVAMDDGLAIFPKKGGTIEFFGTPSVGSRGRYSDVQVVTVDSLGNPNGGTFTLNMDIGPAINVVSQIPDEQFAVENELFSLAMAQPTFQHVNPDARLTYSLQTAPLSSWITINSATGQVGGTPRLADNGILRLTVRVSDASRANAEVSKNISVFDSVTFNNIFPRNVAVKVGYVFRLALPKLIMIGSERVNVTYSLSITQGYLNFINGSIITGKPIEAGRISLPTIAKLSNGMQARSQIDLNMGAPVAYLYNQISGQLAKVNKEFILPIPQNAIYDLYGDDINYSVALKDGSKLPEELVFDPKELIIRGQFNRGGIYFGNRVYEIALTGIGVSNRYTQYFTLTVDGTSDIQIFTTVFGVIATIVTCIARNTGLGRRVSTKVITTYNQWNAPLTVARFKKIGNSQFELQITGIAREQFQSVRALHGERPYPGTGPIPSWLVLNAERMTLIAPDGIPSDIYQPLGFEVVDSTNSVRSRLQIEVEPEVDSNHAAAAAFANKIRPHIAAGRRGEVEEQKSQADESPKDNPSDVGVEMAQAD